VEITCWEQINETSENDLDTRLYKRILKDNQTEKQIEYFSEAMRIACEQSFKSEKATKQSQKNRSVPWWTHELTVIRKTTNHLRRKYQRTRDNAEQMETNKAAYFEQKAK